MFSDLAAQPGNVLLLLLLIPFAGIVSGTLAGMFGIGGGTILVPAISALLGAVDVTHENALKIAIATSLATIIPSSISSLRAHHRHGAIDWPVLRHWAPLIVIGAVLGGLIASHISGRVLSFLFAGLLFFTVWRFLRPQPKDEAARPLIGLLTQRVMAFGIGCSAAMLGIGGGVLGVPALCYAGLPFKRAVGSASTFGMMVAVPGVVTYLLAQPPAGIPLGGTFGMVHPLILGLLTPGAILCAPYGAKLAHRLPVAKLRRAFAILMGLLALKMLYGAIYY